MDLIDFSVGRVVKAANFAAIKHVNQRRKGDEIPYINHPLGVAFNIFNIGKVADVDTLVSAILHDTVEDTNTTLEEIEREFGPKVRSIVHDVTDDKSLPKVERKKMQIEHAPHLTREAKLVKLGDKLYNLTDLATKRIPKSWNKPIVQGYFVWAFFVVKGLRGTNPGLEYALDEIFKSQITLEGEKFPALPGGNLETHLNQYYQDLDNVS